MDSQNKRRPWNYGKHASDETRRKLSIAHMGHRPSAATLKKMSEVRKGIPRSEETKEKMRIARTGKKRSPETVKKMSESMKGHVPWSKGIPMSEETKKKLSLINTGKHHTEETRAKMRLLRPSPETRMKMSIAHIGKFRSAETIRKMLMRHEMTRLEKKFLGIVEKNGLPYKFVGDGSFMIGRKNPDFINVNGLKIAVEVYARYYKLRHAETVKAWQEDRERVFKEYGWTAIFFDETQVNESNILNKLGGK